MTDPAERNKAVVRRYAEEIWNRGNLTALDEFVADDYVMRDPGLPDIVGPEGLREHIAVIRAAFPDHRLEITGIIAEGDEVAWRWQMHGTHVGEFLGVLPTGRRVTMTGIALYRLTDGKVVERHGEADLLGLLEQLGAPLAADVSS